MTDSIAQQRLAIAGSEWMESTGGRLAFNLDLEGQHFMPKATPEQVKEHVRGLVRTLGSFNGGLMLDAWVMPEVPWENVAAMFAAFGELGCGSGRG